MSLRVGTFFEKTKIPFKKFLIIIYWWVRQYPVTQAAKECEVANGTAVDVYQWLREICSWRLINCDDLTLGGTGPIHTNIVQIDKSCFSHKLIRFVTQCSNIDTVSNSCIVLFSFSITVDTLHHLKYGSLVW